MPLRGAILALLLSYPRAAEDASEPALHRVNRLADMADGIALASRRATCTGQWAGFPCRRRWADSPESLAALLAATAFGETGLSARLQRGACRPHECDHGAARGSWQVHAVGPVSGALWRRIGPGVDGVRAGAWAAALMYSAAAGACRPQGAVGTVSAYATGYSCQWTGARRRAASWWSAEAKIRRYASPR